MTLLTKGREYYLNINSPERLACNENHYFACYCINCKAKNFIPKTQAEEFVKNYLRDNKIKYHVSDFIKLPKIKVEWGSGNEKFTPLLTEDFDENIINYMKLKQKQQMSERTKKILNDRSTGKSIVELGKIYGLTRQRIFAILKQYGDTLPKKLSTEG
jgi:hypothetical protein